MSYKIDRIAKEIGREVTVIIQTKLGNPNVPPLTAITDVIVSKDIKYATVYVVVPLSENAKEAVAALNTSAGFIRRELAGSLSQLRTVPALRFMVDNSAAYGHKIDTMLSSIKYEDSE